MQTIQNLQILSPSLLEELQAKMAAFVLEEQLPVTTLPLAAVDDSQSCSILGWPWF